MARTVWVALVFLIFIGGLAALKVSVATPVKQQEAFGEATIGANAQAVLSKSDKLTATHVDDFAPERKAVRVIPITAPVVAKPAAPQEKRIKIISRHWHEGDSKIVKKGTAQYHRDAPQAKPNESRESQLSPIENVKNWFAAKKI
jgi:hypothetical protein